MNRVEMFSLSLALSPERILRKLFSHIQNLEYCDFLFLELFTQL